MKNQSCDGFPGGVTQSRGESRRRDDCLVGAQQVVAASSSDRMMVTTDTASDGKVRGTGRARAHPTRKGEEENEIEEREAEPLCCTVRGV